jgi:hypothetical protein
MTFGEQFLHNPDLFPARHGGETWGGQELLLDLPGGPYRFAGLSTDQQRILRGRFGDFCLPASGRRGAGAVAPPMTASGAAGAVTSSLLLRIDAGAFRGFDLRGWEYRLDSDSSPDAVRLAGLHLVARLDWRPWLAGALWTSQGGGPLFAGIFENFFRVLVAYRLLELGGVVLHSAGVLKGGGALLFLGRSGAGKTTISRLCQERGGEVLSDDLNALVPPPAGTPGKPAAGPGSPASLAVEKLPFTGDLGDRRARRGAAPLHGLFRLEKASDDALRPLSRAEAAACLLACSPFVNADPHRRAALLAAVPRLLGGTGAPPAFALRFSLRGAFWSILDAKCHPSTEAAC